MRHHCFRESSGPTGCRSAAAARVRVRLVGTISKDAVLFVKGDLAPLLLYQSIAGVRAASLILPRLVKTKTSARIPSLFQAQLLWRAVLTLNTHNASSFYEYLPAHEAFALAERFEFIYTPKGASWLNMIECEFSAIARQCLDRRIVSIERLRSEVLALLDERSAKAIKIHWQFSIQAARSKLNSHYTRVNVANQQYKET